MPKGVLIVGGMWLCGIGVIWAFVHAASKVSQPSPMEIDWDISELEKEEL